MLSIAVAGKGGSGKTTFSALTIRYLLESGFRPLLAIDADPNSNLNEALGVNYSTTIGEIAEKLKEVPEEISKEMWLSIQGEEALVESEGFDLLVMGRPEGPGCYCAANNLLRGYIDRLARAYKAMVIDNEAGMEHLSRRLTRDIDTLFIVAEPTPRAVTTAERLLNLAQNLNLSINRYLLVINKVTTEKDVEILLYQKDLPLLGCLPFDENIPKLEKEEKPLFELPESSPYWKKLKELLNFAFVKEMERK